jgi:hypothetical protein
MGNSFIFKGGGWGKLRENIDQKKNLETKMGHGVNHGG